MLREGVAFVDKSIVIFVTEKANDRQYAAMVIILEVII